MGEQTIRQIEGDYAVSSHAVIHRGLYSPSGLVVGLQAEIRGPVRAADHLHLAKGARIVGDVEAGLDVVIGARCIVGGDVRSASNVLVQKGAKIRGRVRARGDLRVCQDVEAAELRADGDVRVAGPVEVGGIEAGGRTAFVEI